MERQRPCKIRGIQRLRALRLRNCQIRGIRRLRGLELDIDNALAFKTGDLPIRRRDKNPQHAHETGARNYSQARHWTVALHFMNQILAVSPGSYENNRQLFPERA